MSRSPIRLLALAASGLLALSFVSPAAAQALGTADAPRIVALQIGVGAIDPATVEVVKGETITFEATNASDTEVEIIIGLTTDVDADEGDSLKEAEEIAPSETKTVTYTFDGDGPYAYGDQIGDHYAAGAKGDIVLVEALTPAASAAESPAASPAAAQALGTADAPRIVALQIGVGAIDPATVEVVKGETITFEATNASDTEVEIIIGLTTDVDADEGDSLKEAEEIAPGETKTVTYTFDGDGPYAYGDQIGDHYAAGAKGDIVLVEALTPAASAAESPAASPAAA